MKFPAGRYYVGDLCYAINDWDKFCALTIHGHDVLDGQFPWRGKMLWTHGTAYGDGCFRDQLGHEYCVDAGLIGVLPAEFIDRSEHIDKSIEDLNELGQIVEFKQSFDPYYVDGKFHIGHLVIDTDPSFEEDESDDE